MQNLSCPSCGAPLNISNRFTKMITCEFCSHSMLIKEDGLDLTGKVANLAELPSALFLGATGTISGKPFEALGRLRYQYDSGMWDEWFVSFEDDQPGWLVEDEGEYKLYHKATLTSAIPPFEQVRVGQVLRIGNREVFITEKGEANIAGGEGQLAFTILPGEEVRYLDGNSGEEQVSIEYTTDEIEFLVGRTIDRAELVVDEEDYY